MCGICADNQGVVKYGILRLPADNSKLAKCNSKLAKCNSKLAKCNTKFPVLVSSVCMSRRCAGQFSIREICV